MADTDSAFDWGIAFNDDAGEDGVVITGESTLGAVARAGGLADGEEYTIGRNVDHINFQNQDDPAAYIRGPVYTVYFVTRCRNLASGCNLSVRVEYDVVTLSQAEQIAACARTRC